MAVFDRLGGKSRMALKGLLFVFLALITFAFALQATFPYDRVKDKIVETLSAKYETRIGSISRGIIPGRITLHDITLRTRPAKPDDPVTIFFVKSLEVHVGLLALIDQTAKVTIDAQIGAGSVSGTIAISKKGTDVHLTGSKLPAAQLPMYVAIGLPMSGTLDFQVDLALPNEKQKGAQKATANWQKADGAFVFKCATGCIFGDGKTKLKAKIQNQRNAAFAADGIDFGKLSVQSLAMRIDIKKGVMKLSQADLSSSDGTLLAELSIQLAPNLDDSDVSGCLRFGGSEQLLKNEPKTYTALTATGAPYGPDKLYHIKLEGKFREIKRRPMLCGPDVDKQNMDDMSPDHTAGGTPGRPNLTLDVDPTNPATAGMPGGSTAEVNPPPPEPADAGIDAFQSLDAAVTVPTPGPEGEVNVPPNDPRFTPEGANGQFQPPPPPGEGQPPPPEGDQQQGQAQPQPEPDVR